jgi:hypothetical protein
MVFFDGKSVIRPESFLADIARKLHVIARKSGASDSWFTAVGLFLVIAEHHGGDASAVDAVQRLHQLRSESISAIDFHCPGWISDHGDQGALKFDLEEFTRWRQLFMEFGLKEFGGVADLILVDAEHADNRFWLNFDQAVRINLTRATGSDGFPTLEAFYKHLMHLAQRLAEVVNRADKTASICFSSQLALAYAGKSFVGFILKQLAGQIGADALAKMSAMGIGRRADLLELEKAYRAYE